ncbi:MAG: hypothetical protein ACFFAE_10685 [Candidatus Hodarchaeota archaeon]
MKNRSLIIFWLLFFVVCIISYFSLQELHTNDIWNNLGISKTQVDPVVSLILNFFGIAFILGCSLITGIFIWKTIFRLSFTGAPLLKFFMEVLQSWITLSGFEGSLIVYAEIFSVLVRGTLFPIYFDVSDIINISWMNIIFVSLFYAIIGFQALRKRLELKRFIPRVTFDTGQVATMTIIGVLILVPFGLLEFIVNPKSFTVSALFALIMLILMYFYYVISSVGILEVGWWFSKRIEREREMAQQELNASIFFLQVSTITIPLLLIFNLFPFPFYLLTANASLWVVFLVLSPMISFSVLMFYHFVERITPELFDNVESGMENLKYQFEKVFAVRGTMFNYPQPVDILADKERTKAITGRWQKVTLKMACGNCFHVFETKAFKDGSKVKPVPCPFCGSMGTTPVWE